MPDLNSVFQILKPKFVPFAEHMVVRSDDEANYLLVSPKPDAKGRDLWFGGLNIKKKYVSVHIFPVYMEPGLLKDISPQLKKRMQGKSCFNFTKVDQELFDELGKLLDEGLKYYQENNLL